MNKVFGVLIALLTCLSFTTQAASYKTITVTSSATGYSEDKAITKALGIAVQQVNGTGVNVESTIRDTDQGIVIDWMGNQTVIPSQEINSGFTSAKAGGLVKSYRVLSSKYIKDAQAWKVTLSVDVSKYANIGADRSHLTQIVVMPFRTLNSSYNTITGSQEASSLTMDLNQRITNQFVESGKFRVLDRAYWKESDVEDAIVSERSFATQESIKLGQKLGADYMLAGTITNFAINAIQEKIYGSVSLVYDTDITIQLRVIEVATSDIISSSNFTQTFDRRQLSRKINEIRKANPNRSNSQINLDIQNYIMDNLAQSISSGVIARILGTSVIDNTNNTAPTQSTKEAKPLTPGSSEKPIDWK